MKIMTEAVSTASMLTGFAAVARWRLLLIGFLPRTSQISSEYAEPLRLRDGARFRE